MLLTIQLKALPFREYKVPEQGDFPSVGLHPTIEMTFVPAEDESVPIIQATGCNIFGLGLEPHTREIRLARPLDGSIHQTASEAASPMRGIDRDILDDGEAIPALGHGDITDGLPFTSATKSCASGRSRYSASSSASKTYVFRYGGSIGTYRRSS